MISTLEEQFSIYVFVSVVTVLVSNVLTVLVSAFLELWHQIIIGCNNLTFCAENMEQWGVF